MTTTKTLQSFPAFRLVRGDEIRFGNRKATIVSISQVVFYPRNARLTGATPDHGVRLAVRPAGWSRTVEATYRNSETVRTYR